jgi:hypothetical protein
LNEFSSLVDDTAKNKIQALNFGQVLAQGRGSSQNVAEIRNSPFKSETIPGFIRWANELRVREGGKPISPEMEVNLYKHYDGTEAATPNAYILKYFFQEITSPDGSKSYRLGDGYDWEMYFHQLGGDFNSSTTDMLQKIVRSSDPNQAILVALAAEALSKMRNIDSKLTFDSRTDYNIKQFEELSRFNDDSLDIGRKIVNDNDVDLKKVKEQEVITEQKLNSFVEGVLRSFAGAQFGLPFSETLTGEKMYLRGPAPGATLPGGTIYGSRDPVEVVAREAAINYMVVNRLSPTEENAENVLQHLKQNFGVTRIGGGEPQFMERPPESFFPDVDWKSLAHSLVTGLFSREGIIDKSKLDMTYKEAEERGYVQTIPSSISIFGNVVPAGTSDTKKRVFDDGQWRDSLEGRHLMQFTKDSIRLRFLREENGEPIYSVFFSRNRDPEEGGEWVADFKFLRNGLVRRSDLNGPSSPFGKRAKRVFDVAYRGIGEALVPLSGLIMVGNVAISTTSNPIIPFVGAVDKSTITQLPEADDRSDVQATPLTEADADGMVAETVIGEIDDRPTPRVDRTFDGPAAKELFGYWSNSTPNTPGNYNLFNMKSVTDTGEVNAVGASKYFGATGVDENGFIHFNNMKNGLRAGFYNLRNRYLLAADRGYADKNYDTIRLIVNKYSPKSDKNDVEMLIGKLSQYMGVHPDEKLKTDEANIDETLKHLGFGIFGNENSGIGYGNVRNNQQFISLIDGAGADELWRITIRTAIYESRQEILENPHWQGDKK